MCNNEFIRYEFRSEIAIIRYLWEEYLLVIAINCCCRDEWYVLLTKLWLSAKFKRNAMVYFLGSQGMLTSRHGHNFHNTSTLYSICILYVPWNSNSMAYIYLNAYKWNAWWPFPVNTLRPRQNGRHFADDIFKCIFLNENAWISLEISLKFVPKVQINNIPALVQIMAWSRPGDKPLSEPMMVSLLTHICVTRPQWVKVILSH